MDQFFYMTLNAIFKLTEKLPKKTVSFLAKLLFALAYPFLRREKRLIKKNAQLIYGLPPHSSFSKKFVKQVLRHQFESFLETLKELATPGSIEIAGLEEYGEKISEAAKLQKGLVVVTAHMGSWELVAKYGGTCSTSPFHALAKPAKYPFLTRFLEEIRSNMNTKILWTDRSSILKEMLGTLKSAGILGFVMDQKPDQRVGHWVNFMNQKTQFVSGPARLSLKTDSLVLGVFCIRTAAFKYRIILRGIPVTSDVTEAHLTQNMASVIEEQIRAYPEQWLWNYRRWSSKPPPDE